jgi:DNA-binding winged helix-turn-helix (wHTH) protein
MSPRVSPSLVLFSEFAADLRTGELFRSDRKVKLQERPFQVLVVLLERAGELVTREELRDRIWPSDTFVDYGHGLAVAVNKLREALGDSPEHPRFVETVGRRGYRFVAAVERPRFTSEEAPVAPTPPAEEAPPVPDPRKRRAIAIAAMVAVIVVGVPFALWNITKWRSRGAGTGVPHWSAPQK